MGIPTRQAHLTPQQWAFNGITVGTVVDTNDPQQMGRVRAMCLALNDSQEALITDIPWSSYAAPFGGTVQAGTMGSDNSEVSGPHAYGMWAIPKIGSQVLIMCLDGNPQLRVWVGCLHTPLATHTMPHGRYSYKTDTNLPDEESPAGPVSSFETTIEPLHTKLRTAFGTAPTGDENFEFQSRGADFQAAGVGLGQLDATTSLVEDDQDESVSGSLQDTTAETSRQGYQTSRIAPDQLTNLTPRNLDNTVTSIVSPGFHAMSMDDRQENCRFRIRTTGGHQIILDDSNERVYLSTANGENWIEMDERGNIDIFTSGKISAHAEDDINFTTERSFRVYAKAGIHLKSDQEIRATAENDISIKSAGVIRTRAEDDVLIESTSKDVHLKAAVDIFQTAQGVIHSKGGTLTLESTGDGSIKTSGEFTAQAGGNANIDGSQVHLNSGNAAASAEEAEPAVENDEEFTSFFTNRIPDHEPWARVDTRADDTVEPEFAYGDTAKVGKKRRVTGTDGIESVDKDITRGPNWRR